MEKEIFDARYDKVREIRSKLCDPMPTLQNGDCVSTRDGECFIVVDGFGMDTDETAFSLDVYDEFGIRTEPKTYTDPLSSENPRHWDIIFVSRFDKEKCCHEFIWGTADNISSTYYHENADDIYVAEEE